MPLITAHAFVLRTYSLGEAHKICVFFAKEYGKVRGVAHGARKIKSRFGSALEPFTEVTLKYHQKEGQELISISSCDILKSHFNRGARDVETANAFSYMAELLVEFVPDHDPNERLYRLVGAVLEAIENGSDLSKALRYFESWLLRLVGFFPDLSQCSGCGEAIGGDDVTFVTADGSPRCRKCSEGNGAVVDPALRVAVREMCGLHPTALDRVALDEGQIARLAEINYQIIRHALERELKSHGLLIG